MSDLSALRKLAAETLALAESATPGPWLHRKSVHGSEYRYVQVGADESYTTLELLPADARHIAHARTAAPSLAKAVEAMALALSGLRAAWGDDITHEQFRKVAIRDIDRALSTLTEVLNP